MTLILIVLESWDLKPSNFQKEQRQWCECYLVASNLLLLILLCDLLQLGRISIPTGVLKDYIFNDKGKAVNVKSADLQGTV